MNLDSRIKRIEDHIGDQAARNEPAIVSLEFAEFSALQTPHTPANERAEILARHGLRSWPPAPSVKVYRDVDIDRVTGRTA